MSVKNINTVVIGAGLTGLSTAFYLKKYGVEMCVLEKSDKCGGVIRTYKEKGFVYESGPNTGVLNNPEVVEMFEDLQEDNLAETADKEAKKRLILKKERWHALPAGLITGITTPLFSLKDKFRLLGEPFRSKGNNPDESVASLVKRRLGGSFLKYAVDPFIGGIYAGNPESLITRYALPKLYNLEQNYGSFIGGAIKKAKEPKEERMRKVSKEVFSAKGGLSAITTRLEECIGKENIVLNARDIRVEKTKEGYKITYSGGEIINCKRVVTTCSANNLKDILPLLTAQEIKEISNVEYAAVSQVVLGYTDWDGLSVKAFGGLVPSVEKRDILGILFTSSFFKNRAPKKGALLSVFMGGIRKPEMIDLSDEELMSKAIEEVNRLLKPKKAKLEVRRVFKHRYAIPQYELSSGARFEAVEKIEKKYKGLIIAGNLKDGIGMSDRVKQGRNTAYRISTNK